MPVRVQEEDFDAGREIAALRAGDARVGAVAAFIGTVRDVHPSASSEALHALTIEHYPGMTERALAGIAAAAKARFEVIDVLVVHRHGRLAPLDQIVLVAVTAAHRGQAFDACAFVMDYLKTDAPFWKKESRPSGERWVASRPSDDEAVRRWREP